MSLRFSFLRRSFSFVKHCMIVLKERTSLSSSSLISILLKYIESLKWRLPLVTPTRLPILGCFAVTMRGLSNFIVFNPSYCAVWFNQSGRSPFPR
ncbi:hypothetical protein [Arsenophonus endosymbiont of Apis mellifera]|uniref:hypothetical protein n=1 Tax=Arsenophonus endosymbiont of Apis mellifera TaxID=1541805 RepID=UPI0015D91D07|nr:hypothetical protein [Arsenophonus endosymbiont of Apis mellifera]